MATRTHRDALGSLLGILVFLGGIALLGVVFMLAHGMFHTPPQEALNLKVGKPIDLNTAGTNLVGVVLHIILLLVMGFVGSMVSNRGIHLYAQSRTVVKEPETPGEASGK